MRYKRQIWDYFIKYTDMQLHHVYFKTETEKVAKLANTFRWLTHHHSPYIKIGESFTKPTNEEIIDAMRVMIEDAERLRSVYFMYPHGDLRKSIMQMSKERIACAGYVMCLVKDDYFANK
jgi:hypothetical protein